jgi:asparagine synthase (glutamine-hydrolysing)
MLSSEFMSPLPSQNYLLYSSLNEKIGIDGFRVAIAGHGGDELFGGYILHQHYYLKSLMNTDYFSEAKANFKDKIMPYLRNKNLKDIESFLKKQTSALDAFEDSGEIEHYFNKQVEINSVQLEFSWNDYFKDKLDEDLFFYTLPQHTIASDQVSMYYSIENRSPYLSRDLYEFARELPNRFLMKKGLGKSILRKSMEDLVPQSVLYDNEKKGFNFEFSKFYIKDFNSLFYNLTKNNFLSSLIDVEKISALSDRDSISNAESKLLFRILNANVFIDEIEKL